MDDYILSLEPDTSSTTSWMRTRIPLVENGKMVRMLHELLNRRRKVLDCARMDEEAKERVGREVGRLVGMVGGWVEGMEGLE